MKRHSITTPWRLAALALIALLGFASPGWTATNQATDPGGGSVSLTGSGNVTVTSTALQLVKQVWDAAGNCLASSPADANCNSSATSVNVPAGTGINFLIFVKNATDVAISDVRFQDLLDDTAAGFTYTAASIQRTPNDGTAPADTETLANIYAAASIAQTDAFENTEYVGIDTSVSADNLLVGGDGTAGNNATLSVPAHKTFAIRFQAQKN